MKKQTKNLVVLASVFVVLLVGYNVIRVVSDNIAAKKSEQEVAESIANIIYVNSLSDFASVTFGEYTFVYSDSADWSYSDSEFPLNSTYIETIASEFESLTASREISGADTAESYGLAEPAYEITFTDSEGNEESFQIGNMVDGEYYVMLNNDTSVIYTCSLSTLNYLEYDLLQFASVEDVSSLWSDTALSYYITDGTNSVYLEDVTEEDAETSTWQVSFNGEEAFEVTDNLDSVQSTLGFGYESLADYNVGDEGLTEYGLDAPSITITVKYEDADGNECEISVYVGSQAESGEYYVMSTQSDDVYLVTEANFELFKEALEYDYL